MISSERKEKPKPVHNLMNEPRGCAPFFFVTGSVPVSYAGRKLASFPE